MKINGKWYFNEVLNIAENEVYSLSVNFISNGREFTLIEVSNILSTPSVGYYGEDESGIEGVMEVYASGSWIDDSRNASDIYRTIDFGAAYQEVSDEFYNWLTANAVQLSKPIPMTHPKGIRLLTKGHKLSKDLEVVPTFAAAETVKVTVYSSDSATGRVYYTAVENGQCTLKSVSVNDTETIIYPIKNTILLFKGDGHDCQADGGEMTKIASYNGYYNEDTDDMFETLYAYQATADGSLVLYIG